MTQNSRRFDMVTLGDLVVDFIVGVERFPIRPGEHQLSSRQVLEAGGAANLLIAGSRIGLKCGALARLGDDIYARFLVEALAEEGVDVSGVACRPEWHTTVAVVLVAPGGEHVFIGGGAGYPDQELPQSWRALIHQSRVLFVEGYAFTDLSPALVLEAVKAAQEAGTILFFDPGPQFEPVVAEALAETVAASQVLLLTQEEAQELTGLADPRAAAEHFRRQGPAWVVIKQGAQGCLLHSEAETVQVPAFPVTVRDPVGAGDSFDAGMVYAYLHGLSLAEAGRLANAMGAATVSHVGAGRNVARKEEVTALLGGWPRKVDRERLPR